MTQQIDKVNQWLLNIGKANGIAQFQLDDAGELRIKESDLWIDITVPSETDWFYLSAEMEPLPSDEPLALSLLQQCLEYNHLGEARTGGTISICPRRKKIFFNYRYSTFDLDEARLTNMINNFISNAKVFKNEFEDELKNIKPMLNTETGLSMANPLNQMKI